jgi:hypothetical protein
MPQFRSEEENIYNRGMEAWTDSEWDAEKCERCGTAIRDTCSGEEYETNECEKEQSQLQRNLDQQIRDEI